MAAPVGIALVLKENLVDRLTKTLPLLEKMEKHFQTLNKTLNNLETSQKRVDSNFKNIGRSVDMVSQKERGLRNVSTGITGIGSAASKSASMLGGLVRTLGLLGVAYKGIQAAEFLGGSALDFQKEAVSLQQSNLPKGLQQRVISQSLALGSSGKYAMSGTDFLKSFKETRSVSPTPEAALANLPFIGQLDMQFRKISEKLAGQADILPRFFEKFGAFSDKDKRTVADALLKTEQYTGGTISPAQILQQISTSGTSVVGADPYKMLTEQAYSIKESAAGAGHGSGGRGRGGVGQQAVDRMMNLGVITPAMANMMAQAGMLDGITASGKLGHDTVVNQNGMMHHTGRSGGSGKLKTSDVSAFLLKSRPDWMKAHANDPYETGLDFAAGADALGGNKIPGSFMSTRDAHIKHFETLPTAEQKFLEGRLMAGMKMTGVDFLMERSVGRYKKSHDYFAAGVAGQPGLSADGETSVKDRWDKLIKGLETFGNALGNNEGMIKTANGFLDTLCQGLALLNQNLGPIAANLSATGTMLNVPQGLQATHDVAKTMGDVGNAVIPSLRNQVERGIRREATKQWHNVLDSVRPITNFLVPPPPVLSGVTNGHEFMPKDFASWDNKKQQSWMINNPPAPITMASGSSSAVGDTHLHINQPIMLDGKKIGDHVAHHVEKRQSKTALKQSYSGSAAGGSYTSNPHNEGGGQSN